MNGWNFAFETNMWYFLPLVNYWHSEKEKIVAEILNEPLETSCSVQDKKTRKVLAFYHNEGLERIQKKFYDMYVNKNFLKTYETLFEKLSIETKKLIVKEIKGEKFPLMKAARIATFGGAIHDLTQPQRLELIELKIQDIKEKYNITQDELLTLLEDNRLISNQLQRVRWLEIIIDIHNKKNISKKLESFQRRFCFSYLIARDLGEKKESIIPITELREEIEKDIAKISIDKAKTEIESIINKNKILQEKKRIIKQKYNLSRKEAYILDMYGKLSYYRLEGRNLWIVPYIFVSFPKDRVAEKLGVHKNDFDACSLEEYCAIVEKGEIQRIGLQPQLQLRLTQNSKTEIYFDNAAKEKIKQLQIPFNNKVPKKVSGEVTFEKGIITGKARIIKWDKHFEQSMNEMKEGEILIVDQTKPDLLPAIRKAKGIITNEGGFISHAAIISRELKIPCIIKTHFATKAFKTGDHIIMNTKTGEVKKK